MVVDVTKESTIDNLSIDNIIHQGILEFNEFCHEACMNSLLSKYTYLQENGEDIPESEQKESVAKTIKSIFNKMIETAKRFIKQLVETIDRKIEELRVKIDTKRAGKLKKDFEWYAKKALNNLNRLNKVDEAYPDVQKYSSEMKEALNKFSNDAKDKCNKTIIELNSDQYKLVQ